MKQEAIQKQLEKHALFIERQAYFDEKRIEFDKKVKALIKEELKKWDLFYKNI